MKKKKVLIIRFSSLGDVALVHPVIKKLSENGYEVHLLTKEKYQTIFKDNPFLNKTLNPEGYKNIFQLIKAVRNEKYFKILDLHKNLRSFLIKLFFLTKVLTYQKFRFRRFLLVHFKIDLLKNNSVPINYLNVLKKMGLSINPHDTDYRIVVKDSAGIKKFIKKNTIVIAPFAKHATKEWVYYADLIEILSRKYFVILVGGQSDFLRAKKYVRKDVVNACGKIDLPGIAALIKESKLLITNDSGIMHLGAGTNTPVVSIFGSTAKEFGFTPLRKNIIIIEDSNLPCRPCDYHGKKNCPKGHFKCMRNISIEKVLTYVRKFVKI